ncbi:hypothetical protein Taro_029451 [Colocasia esculenta]|uniref:Uncharacterized protein n=1 Tax=Colocasia esculenta TaxID=4460 RepID=A0A843W0B9_COLES|nr:hypothetical protein [Colocasia esculenta]
MNLMYHIIMKSMFQNRKMTVSCLNLQAKVVSNHQEEILFLRALIGRCAITANKMLKDIIHPGRSEGQNSTRQHSNIPEIREIENSDPEHEN